MGKTYETVGELLADVVSGEQLRDWIRALWEERHEAKVEIEQLQVIVDKLPKDATGKVIEDGKPYYFPCANGALQFWAYFGPQTDQCLPYPWHKGYRTREAALVVKEK